MKRVPGYNSWIPYFTSYLTPNIGLVIYLKRVDLSIFIYFSTEKDTKFHHVKTMSRKISHILWIDLKSVLFLFFFQMKRTSILINGIICPEFMKAKWQILGRISVHKDFVSNSLALCTYLMVLKTNWSKWLNKNVHLCADLWELSCICFDSGNAGALEMVRKINLIINKFQMKANDFFSVVIKIEWDANLISN